MARIAKIGIAQTSGTNDNARFIRPLRFDEPQRSRSWSNTSRTDPKRWPWLVPAGILAEITYLVERELTLATLESFLTDLMDGPYTLDCGEQDLLRIRALVRRWEIDRVAGVIRVTRRRNEHA